MTVTSISSEQVNLVIEKLDEIERELTRIRAMLLPVETPTKEEAAEFIDYNMTGWMGPQTPIILMVGGKEQ